MDMDSFGDKRPGHRIGKVRKTDECVEICRNKANIDKKTPEMVCECHLQGFLDLYVIIQS